MHENCILVLFHASSALELYQFDQLRIESSQDPRPPAMAVVPAATYGDKPIAKNVGACRHWAQKDSMSRR